jgi:hypothetical protein
LLVALSFPERDRPECGTRLTNSGFDGTVALKEITRKVSHGGYRVDERGGAALLSRNRRWSALWLSVLSPLPR